MVSWASRLRFDPAPYTEHRAPPVPAAFEIAAALLSSGCCRDIATDSRTVVPVQYLYQAGAGSDLPGDYVWDLDADDSGSASSTTAMGFNADSRITFLAAEKRAICITHSGGVADLGVARPASQRMDAPGTAIASLTTEAGRWLTISQSDRASGDVIGWNTLEGGSAREQLALCLIGLLAIAPSVLRRRGMIGPRNGGRGRRPQAGRRYRVT
jgi:hypothetical protein